MKRKSAPSGKFVLRAGESLHGRLSRAAERASCSLNELCVRVLERGLRSVEAEEPFLKRVRAGLSELPVEGIVLFGSRARNEGLASSDVDLLIVLASDCRLSSSLYRLWDSRLNAEADELLSPHFVHLPRTQDQAGGIWLEVALDGQTLFDRNGEITAFLAELRRKIAEGSYVRRMTHGHPYWSKA